MNRAMTNVRAIREDMLRDENYPAHKIADRLLPYLRVLVEQFDPLHVVLFGSYAYGEPDEQSDVDLLVVKEMQGSALKEKLRIRKAWEPVHAAGGYLSVHLVVESPQSHADRLDHAAGFYDDINRRGLALL